MKFCCCHRQQEDRTAALERQLSAQSWELEQLSASHQQQHAQAPHQSSQRQQPVQPGSAAPLAGNSGSKQDASCQAAVEPAADGVHLEASSEWRSEDTGAGQSDEVAAAAQQIAFHAGAASLARQDATRLQRQVSA